MIGFVIWSLLGVFIIYGIIFVILGIPLLDDQNTPYVLLSVIGVMVETIVIMAAYSLRCYYGYYECERKSFYRH